MQFTPSQVDELKEMSETVGVKFQQKQESFDVRRNAKNLMGGFLEGFTTIPTGIKPKTTYESISHSMGHLAGFAPGILAQPVSLLGKGLERTGWGKAAKALYRGSKALSTLNKYSVPMFFGHKATKLMGKGLQKAKLESADFLKKGAAPRGILDEATNLAVASAVSSIWKGPDIMWDSMVHGGVAGGMFGGLGNFRAIGNYLKSNKTIDHQKGEALLKGAIGAGMLGVPAYLRDDPVEMIIYETLLGGYFGYNARPAREAEGGKFIQNLKYEGKSQDYIFKPEDHPNWNNYSKGAQEYVVNQVNEYSYKYIIPKIMESSRLSEKEILDNYFERAKIRFNKEKPTDKDIQTLIREDANQHKEYSMKGFRMEWETSKKDYDRDFDPEDATEYSNIDLKRTKDTPLDILRQENETARDVLIPEISIDSATGNEIITYIRSKGFYEKASEKVGETTYGSVPVEKYENNTTYINVEKLYLGNDYKTSDGSKLKIKPFVSPMELIRNESTGRFEPIVNTKTRQNITESLNKNKQYIFGGVKDKGIYKVRDYHIDTNNYSSQQLMLELSKNINGRVNNLEYSKIQKNYNEGLALELEWLGLKKPEQSLDSLQYQNNPTIVDAIKNYSKQWKSNVLIEAELNGYYTIGNKDISNINNIVKSGHVKHVIDWNKRAQLRFDKSYAIKPDAVNELGQRIFDRDNFSYEIFSDINMLGKEGDPHYGYYRKGKGKEPEWAWYESWTDGVVLIRPEVYDKIELAANLPKDSMFKPVITARMPNGGIMVVKSAGQRLNKGSDNSILNLMNDRGLDMVMFTSAAKHTGNTKPLRLEVNDKGEYAGEVRANNEILSMPINSVRMNLGTYADPAKALKPQTVATQLGSNINIVQSPGGSKAFYQDVISKGPEARINKDGKSFDTILDKYRETGDTSLLKDIKIDDLSTQAIHDIFVRDANWKTRTKEDLYLAKYLSRQILRMDKNGELESRHSFSKDEWKQYLYKNDRILDISDFDSVYRHVFQQTSGYFNNAYKKYMIQRYTRPKWRTSSKAWLNGQLPHNHVDANMRVNVGEIKLDLGMRNMKVEITDSKGNFIENSTLGKAWAKFEKMNAKEKEAYKHNFEFVVVRIPMDSLSGARLLKFRGFTDSRGTSARTHARDDWHLGGADKDSDSVFIYQGFSERVKDIYRPHQNEWGAGTKENPMLEKKSEQMDTLFVPKSKSNDWSNDSFYSPYSQFNPSMRKVVADQAYNGTKIGMGLSAKAGRAALQLWDILPKSQPILDRKGNVIGYLNKKKDGHEAIRRMKMEMMNRSADSSNYPNSTNIGEYYDILLKAGWDAKVMNRDATWNDITLPAIGNKEVAPLSEYKYVRLDKSLDHKAKDWTNDKGFTFDQWRQRTQELLESKSIEGLPSEIQGDLLPVIVAKKMKEHGLFKDIKPLSAELERYADVFNQFKAMASKQENSSWVMYKTNAISNPDMIINKMNKDIKAIENSNISDYAKSKKIKTIIEKTRNILVNDMLEIASWKASTKEGKGIFNYLKNDLKLNVSEKEVIRDLLDPITIMASEAKMRMENFNSDIPTQREGKYRGAYDNYGRGSRDPNVSKVESLDQMITDIHLEIGLLANKYKKVYGANAQNLASKLIEYANLQLLGSYWHKNIPLEKGMWTRPFRNMYYQSEVISDTSVRKMLNAFSDTYKLATFKGRDELPNINREIWESPQDKVAIAVSEPIKKIMESSNPIIGGPKYIKDPTMSINDKAKALGITTSDVQAIKLFEENLKKVPRVAENFNDWFSQFTFIHGDAYRDVSTMTIKDVHAFNRWFKDIDRRFIQRGKGLPPYAWRVDPRYMNEQMALFEGKVFSSFETDVLTSDGVVKRKIKNFTGSMGILREMFRRTNMQIDKYSALDLAQTERTYKFRKQLNKEHAHGINELVIALRNGENITQNKWYEKLKNEIFIYDGKTRTMEEMVNIVNDIYTKDFSQFGGKWIWAKDLKGNRVDWNIIDNAKQYGVINNYLKYNKDGSLNTNYFLKKIGEGLDKGLDLPQIGLENLLRFQYEYKLEKIIKDKNLKGSEAIKYRENFRLNQKTRFEPIGDLGKDYFPHMWENTTKSRQAELDAWLAVKIQEVRDNPQRQAEIEAYLKAEHEMSRTESGGTERPNIDAMMDNLNFKTMTDAQIANYLNNIGFFNRPGVIKERTGEKPGWDRDLNTIDNYKDKIIRSYYKNLQSIFANNRIDAFVKDGKFGEFTGDWADYMRIYVRDSFGHQSTFQERIVDMIEGKGGAKDTLGLGGTLYYKTSDHKIIKAVDYLDAKFSKWGWKVPGFSNIPKITAKEGTPLYKKEVQARREYLSRIIHTAGRMEAKFNLLTLLANTGTMTANVFGGSTMTISQAGLKNFARSYNNKWLQKNILTDIQGNYILKYKDPVSGKDKPVTNKKELRQWVAEQGIIDKFIADEIGVNLALKTGLKGKNGANFIKELGKILTKNPEASNETILELARRYGVQDTIEKAGGWFMQKSERIARADSFITHALQFKERYGAHGREIRLDDPAVIDAGLKGVEATQFLYHSAFRPAYMRTSLGKVLTRFKLFAFQSVRTRKELYRQAKNYGLEEGTPAFERFKNLFLIDMFTMALGTAFTYSLFDTALPPPYDWIQETGEWLFGDKRERDRAFFGQWPYPVAPLQIATPPIARIPMAAFSSLINNDWERFADYHIHTMYPFGRMVRQFDQTFDEPYGTTFGRGMQQFLRLPTDKLVSKLNKAEADRNKKTMIDFELTELGEII